jgi:L-threonylcarbamoyladenylate synthase
MPSHPVALALIRQAGVPIAAPSANVSGKPSPTTADHVLRDLGDRIAGVVDGGSCSVGLESTVVDCSGPHDDTVTILRPGGISREQLQAVIANVLVDPALEKESVHAPRAPGMKYTHYAPRAPVRVVEGSLSFFAQAVALLQAKGEKVGVMCTSEACEQLAGADHLVVCGSRGELDTVARDLYASLRKFDDTDASIILAESFPTSDIGHAIMNRLSKSAGNAVISSLDAL